MKFRKNLIVILSSIFLVPSIFAQDESNFDSIEDDSTKENQDVRIFNSSRLVIGHSVETFRKGEMIMLISHRFDRMNRGAYDAFGIDNANIRIGFEYGVSHKLSFGHGRSSSDKAYDTYVKYKIIQQKTDIFPITVTVLVGFAVKTSPQNQEMDSLIGQPEVNFSFNERVAYNYQLLLAKRFGDLFSLQLMPALIHKNNLELYNDLQNGISEKRSFVIGMGADINLTKTFSLSLEYYLRTIKESTNSNYDAFSMGFNLKTAGHVFQIVLSNSFYTNDRSSFTEIEDDFWNGDIHFGFQITRTFEF